MGPITAPKPPVRSKFHVGDGVIDLHRGIGTVTKIFPPGYPEPIKVSFDNGRSGRGFGTAAFYTSEGHSRNGDAYPTLYLADGFVPPRDSYSENPL